MKRFPALAGTRWYPLVLDVLYVLDVLDDLDLLDLLDLAKVCSEKISLIESYCCNG